MFHDTLPFSRPRGSAFFPQQAGWAEPSIHGPDLASSCNSTPIAGTVGPHPTGHGCGGTASPQSRHSGKGGLVCPRHNSMGGIWVLPSPIWPCREKGAWPNVDPATWGKRAVACLIWLCEGSGCGSALSPAQTLGIWQCGKVAVFIPIAPLLPKFPDSQRARCARCHCSMGQRLNTFVSGSLSLLQQVHVCFATWGLFLKPF